MKLKPDMHEIYNRGDDIERALHPVITQPVAKQALLVEIIPGKGFGQLKKRVLRFLEQRDIRALYHRVEKDSHAFGRVFCSLPLEVPASRVSSLTTRAAGRASTPRTTVPAPWHVPLIGSSMGPMNLARNNARDTAVATA